MKNEKKNTFSDKIAQFSYYIQSSKYSRPKKAINPSKQINFKNFKSLYQKKLIEYLQEASENMENTEILINKKKMEKFKKKNKDKFLTEKTNSNETLSIKESSNFSKIFKSKNYLGINSRAQIEEKKIDIENFDILKFFQNKDNLSKKIIEENLRNIFRKYFFDIFEVKKKYRNLKKKIAFEEFENKEILENDMYFLKNFLEVKEKKFKVVVNYLYTTKFNIRNILIESKVGLDLNE